MTADRPVQQLQRNRSFLVAGTGLSLITAILLALVLVLPRIVSPAPGEQSVDAGFAQDMSIHHQQAVDMSIIVRDRADDPQVRRLAYDILNTQATQRGMMLGWLDLWELPKVSQAPMAWMDTPSAGRSHAPMSGPRPRNGALMPGMATDTQINRLTNASGQQAEVLYLRLMIPHHQSGAAMARVAAANAQTEPVRRLAQAMVESQQAEIQLMTTMLKERGVTP